ncbi:MAG: bifunctional UDP-N-acetylglucosamine diphosphorylase/glucosamine-1-phosphate N-acetyltransferase GlmU [Gammaproteobacteria bacterium]|nr:bifunctional UDP-N-acetylglucosamine diphosphorylase/glucosamine-1-phosphate N-acetyltransferase GlmU [Gammaproteobacteria bacterium]MDH3464871.1 bifunctional UDP-N-acetylglucosamine diphosphorylase/glucosamine-1-phosphate N-acetyltransferase GlmU [Gammaproteobacteria bacterium]
MSLEIVILAAGKGKRMRSERAKVLHDLGGQPLLHHVLATATELQPTAIHVVYGHGGDAVTAAFADAPVHWVRQTQQKGTGHALRQALPFIDPNSRVLVMYGDIPLVRAATLRPLCDAKLNLSILTATIKDASGYGRIIRDLSGAVSGIVEQRDASTEQLAIREINTGFMAASAGALSAWLQKIGNDNIQGEYYLTDVIACAAQAGEIISDVKASRPYETLGVNSNAELAMMERLLQRRRVKQLLNDGVTVRDPMRLDIRGECTIGADCVVDINVLLEGEVRIGRRVSIGANSIVRNSVIGDDVEILEHCVIDGAEISDGCRVGPFARLRPDTVLHERARVGNFVEVKKSTLGTDSKANHLAYVGDATLGRDVNIGAGVITCNYDGSNKHQTLIGDAAFIGSNAQLVAPVTIGTKVTVGAGSTITGNVPDDALAVTRARQRTIRGWKRPQKK